MKSGSAGPNKITIVTRRAIMDELIVGGCQWSGDLNEHDFVGRLYDLKALPSFDGRYQDASGDIYKHQVMNYDWPSDWIFTDRRFDLLHAPDEEFLRFLCETVHPVVRSDRDSVAHLISVFNEHLVSDGWEIHERGNISGKPVFGARPILEGGSVAVGAAKKIADELDEEYVHRQIRRLEDSIDKDTELAIGTAKEFVETLCKTILRERGVIGPLDDFPVLVRATVKALKVVPDGLPASEKTEKTINVLINNLSAIGHHLAELRNPFGTGHGKDATHIGLEKHHARLAVGAASVLAAFLFDCHTADKPR